MRQNSKPATRNWTVHRAVDRPANGHVTHKVQLLTLEEYALIVAAGPEAMARALFRYVRPPSSAQATTDSSDSPVVHEPPPETGDTPPPPPEQVVVDATPFPAATHEEPDAEAPEASTPAETPAVTGTEASAQEAVSSRADWVRRGVLVSFAFVLTLTSTYLILKLLGYDLPF